MAGIKAIGSKLSVNTGNSGSPTWTQIANLTSIGEIGLESDEIDVTTLDSTGDFKEFIGGAKDGGTIDLEGNIVTEYEARFASLGQPIYRLEAYKEQYNV